MAATSITMWQKVNYLVEAIGDGTASQVLAEFPEGVDDVPFETLLATVKCHAVTPEAAAIRPCATYALRQHRGESTQQFASRVCHVSVD